jgi:hypothetical protein
MPYDLRVEFLGQVRHHPRFADEPFDMWRQYAAIAPGQFREPSKLKPRRHARKPVKQNREIFREPVPGDRQTRVGRGHDFRVRLADGLTWLPEHKLPLRRIRRRQKEIDDLAHFRRAECFPAHRGEHLDLVAR